MTLATRIIVREPYPPEEFYTLLNAALGGDENTVAERTPGRIRNKIMQGLRGILDVTYGMDGPIDPTVERTMEIEDRIQSALEYGEEFDADPMRLYTPPVLHCLQAWIDTTYGFSEEGIGTCNDLHAGLVVLTYEWATAKGGSIMWYNEYAGTWHEGTDGLEEFASDGFEAQAWYHCIAKPTIERDLGATL